MRQSAASKELPVFFRSGNSEIFGILTLPMSDANGMVVLLLWGTGGVASFGKNQIRARLARRVGASGYHSMRIDYSGSGESTGVPPQFELDAPVVLEIPETAKWLRARGLSQVVFVGSCFGARSAIAAANQIPGAAGVALISPPLVDERKMSASAQSARGQPPEWASASFLEALEKAMEDKIPLLLMYGTHDGLYKTFLRARKGRLGRLLEEAGDLVTVSVVDDEVHAQSTVTGQDAIVEAVGSWLSRLAEQRLAASGFAPYV